MQWLQKVNESLRELELVCDKVCYQFKSLLKPKKKTRHCIGIVKIWIVELSMNMYN